MSGCVSVCVYESQPRTGVARPSDVSFDSCWQEEDEAGANTRGTPGTGRRSRGAAHGEACYSLLRYVACYSLCSLLRS